MYKLKDYDQEELDGTFYKEELQKVIKEDDVYEVEEVVKKKGKGKNEQYFVKWAGYPSKFYFVDTCISIKKYLKTIFCVFFVIYDLTL